MGALATAADAVLPAFLLIGAGVLADRSLAGLNLETLARLSVMLLIPALVLDALTGTDLTLTGAARLSAAYGAYLVLVGGLAWAAGGDLDGRARRGLVVTSAFGNTGNMGLPITLFAFGQTGLDRAIVLLVLSLLGMFALGPALLAGAAGDIDMRSRLVHVLRLPPLWAVLGGVALGLSPLSLPMGVQHGVALLGDAAIPIMLLSLGMQMHRSWGAGTQGGGESWRGPGARSVLVRLLAGPFVAWGAALALGLEPLDLRVLVLSAAMPAAVTMFVVAVEVGGDARGVGRAVAWQTIASVVAIVAVLLRYPPSV